MKVLNFGSLNIDYVYQVDHIVRSGETISSKQLELHNGGKGLNQSIAMRHAGIDVYHAGMIGDDGENLLNICRENGIHTDFIKKTQERTGNAIIQVDKEGQNSIVLFAGANRQNTREFVDMVLSHFGKGDVVVLQNEINLVDYVIDRASEREMIIVLNPSPFDESIRQYPLDKVDYFFVNEIEGEQLTGEKSTHRIMEVFQKKFPNGNLILTLGDQGAWFSGNQGKLYQTSSRVKAVDTTSAGDTFTGFFLAALLKGKTREEQLEMASVAAGIAVSRKGAADSIPFYDEVEEVLRKKH